MATRDKLFRQESGYGIGDRIRNRAINSFETLPQLPDSSELNEDHDYSSTSDRSRASEAVQTTADAINNLTKSLDGRLFDSPDGYTIGTLAKDAITSFFDNRDRINIQSELGKSIYELDPQIEDYEFEKNYLDLVKQAKESDRKYNDFINSIDTFNGDRVTFDNTLADLQENRLASLDNVLSITPEYQARIQQRFEGQALKGFTDDDTLVRQYLRLPHDERERLNTERLNDLRAQKEDTNNKIEDLRQDLWNRAAGDWLLGHKLTEYYANKEEETPFAFFDLDSWLYKIPGTAGSSFATVEAQAAGIGAAYISSLARTATLRAASKASLNPKVAAAGEIAAQGIAISGALTAIGANVYARHRESLAELYESYKEKIENDAETAGVNVTDLIESGRRYLQENAGSDQNLEDEDVLDLIISSNIPTNSKEFDYIRANARQGLDHLYYQNMALSTLDVAEQIIAFPFMGKLMSSIAKGAMSAGTAAKAAKYSERVTRSASKALDNAIEFGHKVTPKLVKDGKNIRAFGKNIVVGVGGRLALVMASEGAEEGIQYIQGQRFVDGQYDGSPNLINSLWNNTTAIYEGLKAITGIGESIVSDDDEFFQNVKAGMMLGALLGGAASTVGQTTEYVDQLKANKFVRNLTADQIKEKEDFAKAQMYAQAATLKRQDQIIQALEWTKESLPEGVTVQDIDEEIVRAKKVMALADSPFMRTISRDLGIKRGTDDFHNLMAMTNYTLEKYNSEREINSDLHRAYDAIYNSEDFTSVVESLSEDTATRTALRNIVKFNTEREAVQDLLEAMIKNRDNIDTLNKHYGFSIDKTKVEKYIKKLQDYVTDGYENTRKLNEFLRQNGNFTAQDIETYVGSYSGTFDPKLQYQKMLLSDMSLGDAFDVASAFNGIYHPIIGYGFDPATGNLVQQRGEKFYTKLNKKEKAEVQGIIREYLDGYKRVEQATESMDQSLADAETSDIAESEVSPNIPDNNIDPIDVMSQEFEARKAEALSEADSQSASEQQERVGEEQQSTATSSEYSPTYKELMSQAYSGDDAIMDEAPMSIETMETAIPGIPSPFLETDNSVADKVPEATSKPSTEQTESEQSSETQPVTPEVAPKPDPLELTPADIQNANAFESLAEANSEEINQRLEQGVIPKEIIPNAGNDSKYGKTSNTFFYNPNSNQGMESYLESGEELSKLLANPENHEHLSYEYRLSNFDKRFNPTDEKTWDYAAILMIVSDNRNDKQYGAALKTPDGASLLHQNNKSTEANTTQDVTALRTYRNQIIEAVINAEQRGATVRPATTHISNGLFNTNIGEDGRVINRPINKVKGFNIPTDPYAIDNMSVLLGIGLGVRGQFAIIDQHHNVIPGRSGSGKIYIYPPTPSDQLTPVKLNEKRFTDDPDIVDLIFDLLVKYGNNEADQYQVTIDGRPAQTGFSPKDLLGIIINNGKHTIVPQGLQQDLFFLLKKQLNFDSQSQSVQYGNTITRRQDLLNDPAKAAEFKRHIQNNLHWSMPKAMVWGKIGDTNPRIKGFFEAYEQDKLVIIPGKIEFDLQDVGLMRNEEGRIVEDEDHYGGLSWISWYAKNGILQSDLQDQIFKDPFLYGEGIIVEEAQDPVVDNESESMTVTTEGDLVAEETVTTPTMSFQDLMKRARVETGEDGVVNPIDTREEAPTSTQTVIDNVLSGIPMDNDPSLHMDSEEMKNFLGIDRSFDYRLTDDTIEPTEAKQWLMDTLGLDSDEVIITDKIIRLGQSGVRAMGLTRDDSIVLYNMAEAGTQYHEAFHRVSLLLLDDKQRTGIYNEYRRNQGDYSLSDTQVEEALAENFRDWMMSNTRQLKYKIGKFFRNMFSFIKAVRRMNDNNIEDLYNKISRGDFRDVPVNYESVDRFKELYSHGAPYQVGTADNPVTLQNIPTLYNYYKIVDSLQAMIFFSNGVKTIQDVSKLDANRVLAILANQIKSDKTSEQQKNTLAEVIQNWENAFWPDLKQSLENLGVKAIDRLDQDNNSAIEAGDVRANEIQWFNKPSFEISRKENALASAKFFMATIAETHWEYYKTPHGVDKKLVSSIDELTGLPTFVDFDTSWNKLLNALHNVETFDDILVETAKQAAKDPFFASVHKKLSRDIDENLATQLLQTIKSHKHNMIFIGYSGERSTDGKTVKVGFRVGDSNTLKASRIYPLAWSNAFFNQSGIVSVDGTKIDINKEAASKVVDRYNKLLERSTDLVNERKMTEDVLINSKKELLDILQGIGITIDMDVLNTFMLNDGRFNSLNGYKSFVELLNNRRSRSLYNIINKNFKQLSEGNPLTDSRGKTKPLDQIYKNDSFITALAEAYSDVHPRPEELGVLGADGNLLYPISEHNYMSDMTRWLNEKPEQGLKMNPTVQALSNVTYNKGSIILNGLKQGKKLQLNTFVNFTEESTGDRGRKYLDISPIEDYIAKMTLAANDHIVLPTMADKPTYHTLSGIPLYHYPVTIMRDGTLSTVMLDNQILSQYLRYAEDEWNTIKQYYSKPYQDVLAEDPNRSVKNYHSKHLGGRFRYFTGIWLNVDGNAEFTDMNSLLDRYEKQGKIQDALALIDKQFFAQNTGYKLQAINTLLKSVVRNELDTAAELGIIEIKDTEREKSIPTMRNLLLDQVLLDKKIEVYKNSNDPVLMANAETYAIYDMISDYTVNSMIGITEFEKVFTKDPAFYKNTDDKIKRLSEVLSTGANLRTEILDRTSYSVTEINDNEIKSAQANELLKLFERAYIIKFAKQINGLTEAEIEPYLAAIDAYNQELDDASIPVERDALPDYDDVVTAARLKAKIDMKGYMDGSINQADAAVYISPKMYADIKRALGEWNDDIAEAFQIIENDDNWTSNPEAYQKAMQTVMQPLKMTSFNDRFDPELGIDIPIYDKMALFPLFKAIATGDLRTLYDRMTAQGAYEGQAPIDMVKFSSAVKVGSQATSSFYTDKSNTKISNLNEMPIYGQEFKYLRRQLNTDPHSADRQMLGTQAAKAALSNIIPDRKYGRGDKKITGTQIKQEVFGAMNALSNQGALGLLNQIGSVVDGEFVGDIDKLSALLGNDAKQTGLAYDILQALEVKDGEFRVPLSALSDSKWIESRWTSLVNKNTIDINLPGGAYIQMSSFGFKAITPTSDYMINNGKRLNFINPDGSMDAIVSINLLMHIVPEKLRKSHTLARQWLLDNNVIGENAQPSAMGYRIPTQGLSSIAAMKIVDVLPAIVGDTVVLPDEFTKLTGSDFDIDKLYIARYNYDKEGNIIKFKDDVLENVVQYQDYLKEQGFVSDDLADKTKWDLNTREANENRLLEMYMTVLTDNSNVDETRLPLDSTTDYLKGTVLKNVDGSTAEALKTPYMDLSPSFQLSKKTEYTGGKDGIAPFALNNVHHVLTQLTNLSFKNLPIMEKFGLTRLDRIDSRGTNSIRILDWLSALINAHVDVAKDPYIIRMNIVQWTYNMTNLLLRTGVGENTFYFMPQPILKEMARKVDLTNGRYGVDNTKSQSIREKDAIESVYQRYHKQARDLAVTREQKAQLDALALTERGMLAVDNTHVLNDQNYLLEQLRKGRDGVRDFDYFYNQLLVYKTFEELDPFAKGLSELVHTTQIDTKKFGNNFMLQKSFEYRIKRNILDNNVFATQDMQRFYTETFLYTKAMNSLVLSRQIFQPHLIRANDQFVKYHNAALAQMGQLDTKNDRLINATSNALESDIKSRFFSQYVKDNNINTFQMIYGDNTIAKRLIRLKSDILAGKYADMLDGFGRIKNDLLNYIDGRPGNITYDGYYAPDYVTTNTMNENDKYLQNKLKRYFQELLDSPHQEIQKFARDLVIYAFQSTGDNFTMNGIFNLVPINERERIGYTQYMRKTMDDMNDGMLDMNLDDVFKNNWHNSQLVPDIKFSRTVRSREGGFETRTIEHIMSKETIPGTNLRYPIIIAYPYTQSIGLNSEKQPLFRPYIKYNIDKTKNPTTTILYKYIGNYNEGDRVTPIYKAVDKKGMNSDGIVWTEYDGYTNSALAFNNLPRTGQEKQALTNFNGTDESIKALLETASFNNEFMIPRYEKLLKSVLYLDNFDIADDALYMSLHDTMTTRFATEKQYSTISESQTVSESSSEIIPNIESILKDEDGNILELYRGYALNEDRLANNIEETLPKQGELMAIDYVTQGIHFSTDESAARSYADLKSDKIGMPTKEDPTGSINKHFRGEYGQVSKFYATGNNVYRFHDARAAEKAISNNEINDWDIIILEKDSTPFSNGMEVIVRNTDQIINEIVSVQISKSNTVEIPTVTEETIAVTVPQTIPENTTILNFNSRENPEFSNFYKSPITMIGVDGKSITYPTVEHAFQAAKAGTRAEQDLFTDPNMTASQAKMAGRRVELIDGWDDSRLVVMGDILEYKFNQHPELKQKLMNTVGSYLVHDTSDRTIFRRMDNYWGNGWYGDGANNLGKLLMKLRNEYLIQNQTETVIETNTLDNLGSNIINVLGKDIDLKPLGVSFKLNDQQVQAINEIVDWARNTQDQGYALEGYAGTGKSTIMRIVDNILENDFNSIVPVAPTHQAKGVLSDYMGKTATTVHSLLGLGPNVDLDKFDLANLRFAKVNRGNTVQGGLYIIDESSMINDDLTEAIIQDAISKGNKVLFVGDPKQIQPVNQQHISSVFTRFNKSVLNKIERQKNGNPLLDVLVQARENIDMEPQKYAPRYDANFNEFGKGLVVANTYTGGDARGLINFVANAFKSQEFLDNPRLIRWLAYRNDTVASINGVLRTAMGYSNSIEKNELLKAYSRFGDIQNSDELIVTEVQRNQIVDLSGLFNVDGLGDIKVDNIEVKHTDELNQPNIKATKISVVTDITQVPLLANALTEYNNMVENRLDELYDDLSKGRISKGGYFSEIKDIQKNRLEITQVIASMYPIKGTIYKSRHTGKGGALRQTKVDSTLLNKTFDYGYASTTHKAQGSTYKNVVISYEDIMNNQNYTEKMRLLYTAMSRPTDAAILQARQDVSENMNFNKYLEIQDQLKNDYNTEASKICRNK